MTSGKRGLAWRHRFQKHGSDIVEETTGIAEPIQGELTKQDEKTLGNTWQTSTFENGGDLKLFTKKD